LVDVLPEQPIEEAVFATTDHDQIRVPFPGEREQPLGRLANLGHILLWVPKLCRRSESVRFAGRSRIALRGPSVTSARCAAASGP
jgi:hypothetical protein